MGREEKRQAQTRRPTDWFDTPGVVEMRKRPRPRLAGDGSCTREDERGVSLLHASEDQRHQSPRRTATPLGSAMAPFTQSLTETTRRDGGCPPQGLVAVSAQ